MDSSSLTFGGSGVGFPSATLSLSGFCSTSSRRVLVVVYKERDTVTVLVVMQTNPQT